MSAPQYVVMKAYEGLGDRLEVLSHCIEYCKIHNASLCVDWRDPIWVLGYSDFFEIVGIPLVTLEEVGVRIDSGAIISPPAWTKDQIMNPLTQTILKEEYIGLFMNGSLDIKTEGDVLVTNGRGLRRYKPSIILKHVIFKQKCPIEKPYQVVHLRGTDRFKEGSHYEIFKKFMSLRSRSNAYLISDSKDLVDKWITWYPAIKLVRPSPSALKLPSQTKKGSHKFSESELEAVGVTKRQILEETILDFIILMNADESVGLEESYFYRIARSLNDPTKNTPNDLINKIRMFQRHKPTLPISLSTISTISTITTINPINPISDRARMIQHFVKMSNNKRF